MDEGRTALWCAVFGNRPDNARILLDAGADPGRPMMSGWTPGRLSLAGPHPLPGDHPPLTADETAAIAEARQLLDALTGPDYEGLGLACVAGVSAEEAARRLGAEETEEPPDYEDLWASEDDEDLRVVGVTDVRGGCVVTQPWGYAPQMSGVLRRLSACTVAYGLYENPKSGSQGCAYQDGEFLGREVEPGDPGEDAPPEEVLAHYLYQNNAAAFGCAYTRVLPPDTRALMGPPDRWLRLPFRGYWN